jgi:hypothetical protein
MKEERSTIIKTITTPLGFFALSLLIAEGFLGIVLIFSKGNLSENFYFWGMVIGASLFVLVIVLVWILVWYRTDKIIFTGKEWLAVKKINAQKNYKNTPLQKDLKSTNEASNEKLAYYYPELTDEEKAEIVRGLEENEK